MSLGFSLQTADQCIFGLDYCGLLYRSSSRDQATGRLGRNSRPRGLKVALGSPEDDKKTSPSVFATFEKEQTFCWEKSSKN